MYNDNLNLNNQSEFKVKRKNRTPEYKKSASTPKQGVFFFL